MTAKAPVGVALLAGVLGAVQPKINAVLGSELGSALVASVVNFAVALAFVVIALALRPATRRKLAGLRSWSVPRWTLTAGLGGAIVVVAGAVAVDTIGVALFSIAFFAGQVTFSLVVDVLAIGPGGKRPMTPPRLGSVVLAVAAVVVSQVGRTVGEFAPELVVFVVVAGAAIAFQSAFNGRIALATRDPVAATAVNVVVGTVALVTIVTVVAASGQLEPLQWPGEPWLYAGGALGVTVVLTLAIASAALGVLRATIAVLAAQMITAFAVDWVIDNEGPTAGAIAGAVLIVAAVALVGRTSGPPAAPARREDPHDVTSA